MGEVVIIYAVTKTDLLAIIRTYIKRVALSEATEGAVVAMLNPCGERSSDLVRLTENVGGMPFP